MKRKDVPQDAGVLEQWHEICYATDEDGSYRLVPSSGWEAATAANRMAWEAIEAELDQLRRKVAAGEASPLEFHMRRSLMDVKLLARYAGLARWRVRRHLRPATFARLKPALLERYADVLGVTVDELGTVTVDEP